MSRTVTATDTATACWQQRPRGSVWQWFGSKRERKSAGQRVGVAVLPILPNHCHALLPNGNPITPLRGLLVPLAGVDEKDAR